VKPAAGRYLARWLAAAAFRDRIGECAQFVLSRAQSLIVGELPQQSPGQMTFVMNDVTVCQRRKLGGAKRGR
jgi:hypothetical protein